MKTLRDLLSPYFIIFRVALFLLILFTLYRIGFVIYNRDGIPEDVENKAWLFFRSFAFGINFDLVVICFILAPFLIILFIRQILRKDLSYVMSFFKFYVLLFSCITFLVCCADIPYYKQFGNHLNKQCALWLESPSIVLGLIFSNVMYWGFLVLFIVSIVLIARYISKIFKSSPSWNNSKRLSSTLIFIFLGLLCLLGMRGRIGAKSTIRIGTAFFSEHYFFNQLGLNPNFVFAKSLEEKNADWDFLKDSAPDKFPHPQFNKEYSFDTVPSKHNVIVVLMESMAISKMGYYGMPKLTSRFDTIASRGIFFDHFYSAGIHTFNGLFSTETGFPAVMDLHSLNRYNKKAFPGIAWWLKQNGYANYFFTSHDAQFDNIAGFMKFNSFDRVYSQPDYPSEKVIGTLGVPDHYLYSYVIDRMNEHVQSKSTPFFSFILSSSDHTPYELPSDIPFKPSAESKEDKATQYADWSIGNFIEQAKKQSWFKNTLFIFVADHGMHLGNTYAMPLSYNHIPCVYYMPSEIAPDTVSSLGGQIDLMPTTLSFLKIPFKNTSMGIDLLHETRPYMYFSADNKIGCIDHDWYYIHLFDEKKELLYQYKDLNTHSFLEEKKSKADSMKAYSHEMIRNANKVIENLEY
jgi:phosphoglycerol transferase MdoB-like AlkP superfamily enzyme